MVPSAPNWNFSLLATSKSIHFQNSQHLIKSEFAQIIWVKPKKLEYSNNSQLQHPYPIPHSKIIYPKPISQVPNHIVSDIDLRLQQPQLMMQNFCFVQDKTPKAFWLYHLLICYIPHFYHLWRGIPYPTKMGPSTVACGQSLWGLSQKGLRALDPIELW